MQFPGLFDRDASWASRTMYDFDNVVTAPLHGFRDTDDYWSSATTRPLLPGIAVPTLVLNARNDPFLPAEALPARHEVSAFGRTRSTQGRRPRRFYDGAVPGPHRLVVAARARLSGAAHRSWMTSSSRPWPSGQTCRVAPGWLMLDRRGNWRMRDEAAQASGCCPARRFGMRRCSGLSIGTTTPMTKRAVVFPEMDRSGCISNWVIRRGW